MLTPNTSPSCFSTINSDSRFVRQLGGRDQSPGPVAHFLGSLVGAQQTALHQGALRPPVGHTMQGGVPHAQGSLSMFAAQPLTSPGQCLSYSSHLCGSTCSLLPKVFWITTAEYEGSCCMACSGRGAASAAGESVLDSGGEPLCFLLPSSLQGFEAQTGVAAAPISVGMLCRKIPRVLAPCTCFEGACK